MESSTHPRSIDGYLEELYEEYKRRLPHVVASHSTGAPSSYDGCTSNQSIWQYRHYLPCPLLALCIANSSDATEILMLSYLLADSDFKHDMLSEEGAEYLAASISASIFFGMLVGGIVLGFLSDHIGRRPALLAGLLINATAGLFSSFPLLTPDIQSLSTWRFIAGIGIGATVPSLFSLASEWSPKEVRGSVVTFVASFWMVGSLFVSSLAWILFSRSNGHDLSERTLPTWRLFAAICALPSALGAWMVYWYVPESPRFLASGKQHQYKHSANACNLMASFLGVKLVHDGENADCNHPRIEDNLLNEPETHANNLHSGSIKPLTEEELRPGYSSAQSTEGAGNGQRTPAVKICNAIRILLDTIQKLYSPKLLTRTTLPLQTIWFTLSFGTYGITTWINTLFVGIHLENIYFNAFLFALATLPGNIISIMYSDKLGRKRMLVGSLLGAAGGLTVFAILVYSGNPTNGDVDDPSVPSSQSMTTTRFSIQVAALACFFQACSVVSWNTVDILSGEQYPTEIRSAGMGVCTACGRFGAMFAQVVNAHLMVGGGGAAFVLFIAALSLLVGAGMPFCLDRDMALGELKDEINPSSEEASSSKSFTLGCMKRGKDHLSDDKIDKRDIGLRRMSNEYQSFQRENDAFLL